MKLRATGGSRQAAGRLALLTLLLLFSPALFAEGRTPDEAERLYQQVGKQMFCICGCRENLLSCSHNVCSAKTQEREFLAELAKDSKLDEVAIKQKMVERFGAGVLQVPESSALYPVLIVSVVVLLAAFGAGLWVVTRKADRQEAPLTVDPEVEARIAAELEELD